MSFQTLDIQENYTLLQNTSHALTAQDLQQQLASITTVAVIWKIQHLPPTTVLEVLATVKIPPQLFVAVAADVETMQQYSGENPQITVLPTVEECVDAVFMYLLEQQFNAENNEHGA